MIPASLYDSRTPANEELIYCETPKRIKKMSLEGEEVASSREETSSVCINADDSTNSTKEQSFDKTGTRTDLIEN